MVPAPVCACEAARKKIAQKNIESIQFWIPEKLNRQDRSIIKEVIIWYTWACE